jgi:predicted TIM-barrel enzyme
MITVEITKILDHIQALRQKGSAIVVAGVGSGITAKAASNGGADILATYNTAVYRMQGLPTGMAFLPYDDCNELSFSVAPQVLAGAGNTPVIIGLGAHDPRRNLDILLDRVQSQGLAGVTNEPFIGMYEGDIRRQMEACGLGFNRELELLEKAAKKGMLTLGYVFEADEAIRLVMSGVHIICAMVGGVTSGRCAGGAKTISLEDAASIIREIVQAVSHANDTIPVLIHGGPLNDVESVSRVLARTGAAGYVSGSTGERIPTEVAVKGAIEAFKEIRTGYSE